MISVALRLSFAGLLSFAQCGSAEASYGGRRGLGGGLEVAPDGVASVTRAH